MNAPDLFDWQDSRDASARGSDPETSHDAAEFMSGNRAGRVESIVLDALRHLGGRGTMYQVEVEAQKKHSKLDSNTITPRFRPLETKGFIRRTDERGPGRGSRKQIVWEAME